MLSCGCSVLCPKNATNATVASSTAHGLMSGRFTSNLTTILRVKDNSATDPMNPVQITSSNSTANTSFDGPLSVCGGQGDFYGNGPMVEKLVTDALKSAMAAQLTQEAQSFNAPTVVRLFQDVPIFMRYNLHDFAFAASTNISAKGRAVLYATQSDHNITFVDPDESNPPEASLYPPGTNWTVSEDGSRRAAINGLQLSTTSLTGVTQLANELGYFAYGTDTQVTFRCSV